LPFTKHENVAQYITARKLLSIINLLQVCKEMHLLLLDGLVTSHAVDAGINEPVSKAAPAMPSSCECHDGRKVSH
jgi:hypothetical protein